MEEEKRGREMGKREGRVMEEGERKREEDREGEGRKGKGDKRVDVKFNGKEKQQRHVC